MRLVLFMIACGSTPTSGSHAYDWTHNAQAFFAQYCVSCHTPGGQAQQQDFALLDVVKANAANIRCGVATTQQSGCGATPTPKQFPIGSGPKPSDAERSAIVAWIDAGLP